MSDAPQSHAAAGPARRPGCFAVIAWILVGLGVACTIPTLIVSIVPGIWETAPFHIRLVAAQGPAALLAGAATLILRRALAGHF